MLLPQDQNYPKIKIFSSIKSTLVYMRKEAALQYVLNLTGSSLQKREACSRDTRENYKLPSLFPLY